MTKEERIRLWESYNSKVNELERELLDEVMKHQTDMTKDRYAQVSQVTSD